MVLVIDNYDSFTYNLVQYLGELDANVVVVRNDRLSVDALLALRPDRVVISPGPGRPEQGGVTLEMVRRAGERLPVLGVCLGHQAIGLAFGGAIVRAPRPVHGKASRIEHDGRGLFAGIGSPLLGGRYHSLMVSGTAVPPDLEISARTADEDAVVMGLRHRTLPIHGVQFHPESVLTVTGRQVLRNFMAI